MWSDLAEIQTSEILCLSSLHAKCNKDKIKTEGISMETSFSPLYAFGWFLLPWKPEVWSNLFQMFMQPFSHHTDAIATCKIWLSLATWLRDIQVWKCVRMDGRLLLYYKLTFWAFSSGELKIWKIWTQEKLLNLLVSWNILNNVVLPYSKLMCGRAMTKPTKWLCAQWRLTSACASPQFDQCLCCALSG